MATLAEELAETTRTVVELPVEKPMRVDTVEPVREAETVVETFDDVEDVRVMPVVVVEASA